MVRIVLASLIGELNHCFDMSDATVCNELVLQVVSIGVQCWRYLCVKLCRRTRLHYELA